MMADRIASFACSMRRVFPAADATLTCLAVESALATPMAAAETDIAMGAESAAAEGTEAAAAESEASSFIFRTGSQTDGSLTVHQDVALYLASLREGEELAYDFVPGRHAWLQVLRGKVLLAGHTLSAGDGAAVSGEDKLEVRGQGDSELMLFDLA